MLASAKEQHRRELAEQTEQREALQDKFKQLQEKVHQLSLSYGLITFLLMSVAKDLRLTTRRHQEMSKVH